MLPDPRQPHDGFTMPAVSGAPLGTRTPRLEGRLVSCIVSAQTFRLAPSPVHCTVRSREEKEEKSFGGSFGPHPVAIDGRPAARAGGIEKTDSSCASASCLEIFDPRKRAGCRGSPASRQLESLKASARGELLRRSAILDDLAARAKRRPKEPRFAKDLRKIGVSRPFSVSSVPLVVKSLHNRAQEPKLTSVVYFRPLR